MPFTRGFANRCASVRCRADRRVEIVLDHDAVAVRDRTLGDGTPSRLDGGIPRCGRSWRSSVGCNASRADESAGASLRRRVVVAGLPSRGDSRAGPGFSRGIDRDGRIARLAGLALADPVASASDSFAGPIARIGELGTRIRGIALRRLFPGRTAFISALGGPQRRIGSADDRFGASRFDRIHRRRGDDSPFAPGRTIRARLRTGDRRQSQHQRYRRP